MNLFDPTNLTDLNIQLAKLDSTLNPVTIRNIFVEKGARNKLFELLDDNRNILLVMDDTKMRVGDNDLKKEIENELTNRNIKFKKIIFKHKDSLDGIVHADWENVNRLRNYLGQNIILVSIGSGTITDISKHASYVFSLEENVKLPLIVLQTANTVTAYTSNIAVILKDGVKRTYPSRYPDYVLSDIEVLQSSPYELTQAGFGDLLARYVSYADWYLGYKCKNLDRYTEVPKLLLDKKLEYLVKNADKIKIGDEQAYEVLTKTLLNAGISMSIVGMSTPISGFEHVISHILDMISNISKNKADLHGVQVGIATMFVAYAYEELLAENENTFKTSLQFPKWNNVEKKMKSAFLSKNFSEKAILEMLTDYKIKYNKWIKAKDNIYEFFKLWNLEKENLRSLLKTGNEIKNALKKIGIEIKLPNEMKFAFQNAHFIRKRFTSADLFFFLNKLNSGLYKRIAKRVSDG